MMTYMNWICGCESKQKLFCWSCLMFRKSSSQEKRWSLIGFNDLNHLHDQIKKHETSAFHIENQFLLRTFGDVRIDIVLDSQRKANLALFNEQVNQNRIIFGILVEIVIFLSSHGLPFRGHDETKNSNNKGLSKRFDRSYS